MARNERGHGVDHLQRGIVIELPYLDEGRRVFVAVDDRGWKIDEGTAITATEEETVLYRLHDALAASLATPRLSLVTD